MANTIPAQMLHLLKARKFGAIGKLYAPGVDFQAWNPSGHWVASDAATIAKIFEVWFSPGVGATIVESHETATARAATLEYEISWKLPPDDQPRVLRQFHLMTLRDGRITSARIYCAGLHTDFPEVDLEKQRRAKGLAVAAKTAGSAAKSPVAAKAS